MVVPVTSLIGINQLRPVGRRRRRARARVPIQPTDRSWAPAPHRRHGHGRTHGLGYATVPPATTPTNSAASRAPTCGKYVLVAGRPVNRDPI